MRSLSPRRSERSEVTSGAGKLAAFVQCFRIAKMGCRVRCIFQHTGPQQCIFIELISSAQYSAGVATSFQPAKLPVPVPYGAARAPAELHRLQPLPHSAVSIGPPHPAGAGRSEEQPLVGFRTSGIVMGAVAAGVALSAAIAVSRARAVRQ